MITGLLKQWRDRNSKKPNTDYLRAVIDNALNSITIITDDVIEPSIPRIVREIAFPDYAELQGWTLFFDERSSKLWKMAINLKYSNSDLDDLDYVMDHMEEVLAGIQGTWVLLQKYLATYTQQRYLDRMENYNRMVAFYTAIWATLNTVYVDLPSNIQRIVSRAQGKKVETNSETE